MSALNLNPEKPKKRIPVEYTLIGFIFFFIAMLILQWAAVRKSEIRINHNGKFETIPYYYFVPLTATREPMQVMVTVGDLGDSGKTFMSVGWLIYGLINRIAIVAPEFPFSDEDWAAKESFQFPEVWSGGALISILDDMAKKHPIINRSRLLLMGFSAGGQFVTRFAAWRPNLARAVAVHGCGNFDPPRTFIPVIFLVSVGQLDIARIMPTEEFVDACMSTGTMVQYFVTTNVGHKLSKNQIKLTRNFFRAVLAGAISRT